MYSLSRFLLIVSMLVLLPLRGWAGNVMAVDMAAMTVAKATMANASSLVAMPADCVMHSASGDEVAAQSCNCDTCELCLLVVNLTPAPWTANQLMGQSSPLAFNASFTSAAKAFSFKPPIS